MSTFNDKPQYPKGAGDWLLLYGIVVFFGTILLFGGYHVF